MKCLSAKSEQLNNLELLVVWVHFVRSSDQWIFGSSSKECNLILSGHFRWDNAIQNDSKRGARKSLGSEVNGINLIPLCFTLGAWIWAEKKLRWQFVCISNKSTWLTFIQKQDQANTDRQTDWERNREGVKEWREENERTSLQRP